MAASRATTDEKETIVEGCSITTVMTIHPMSPEDAKRGVASWLTQSRPQHWRTLR